MCASTPCSRCAACDIFGNVLLLVALGETRGREVFAPLVDKFRDDAEALAVIEDYRKQLEVKPAR